MKELVEIFRRLDAWANRIQIHLPRILRVSEDLTLLKRLGLRFFKLACVLLVVGGILGSLYWVFSFGSIPAKTDPGLKLSVPTLEPSPTAAVYANPWSNQVWMTPEEARGLRPQTNVINLAYLNGGGASYSVDHSVVFDETLWHRAKPFGMNGLSVNGTSVTFTVNLEHYTLNVYQPFILAETPNQILLADISGNVWAIDISNAEIVGVDTAIQSLDITIGPNPNLSFTY